MDFVDLGDLKVSGNIVKESEILPQEHSYRGDTKEKTTCWTCGLMDVEQSQPPVRPDLMPCKDPSSPFEEFSSPPRTPLPEWTDQERPLTQRDMYDAEKRLHDRFDKMIVQLDVSQKVMYRMKEIEQHIFQVAATLSGTAEVLRPDGFSYSEEKPDAQSYFADAQHTTQPETPVLSPERPRGTPVVSPERSTSRSNKPSPQKVARRADVGDPAVAIHLMDVRCELEQIRIALGEGNLFQASPAKSTGSGSPHRYSGMDGPFCHFANSLEQGLKMAPTFFVEEEDPNQVGGGSVPRRAESNQKIDGDDGFDADNAELVDETRSKFEMSHYRSCHTVSVLWHILGMLHPASCDAPATLRCFSALLILANIVILSWIEAATMNHELYGNPMPEWVNPSEVAFVIAFTVELALHISTMRLKFFTGKDKYWNIVDIILILSSVGNLLFASANLSFARAIRVLRLMRVTRVFRLVEELRTLRLMAAMISSAMISLAWALVFVAMFSYVACIFFMGRVSAYLAENTPSEEVRGGIIDYWSSFSKAFVSIIAAVTGGFDWMDVATPLREIDSFSFLMFFLYILFIVFGLLNVLTGVVVESTKNMAEVDRDLVIEEAMDHEASFANDLKRFFEKLIVESDPDRKPIDGIPAKDRRLQSSVLKATLDNNRVYHYLSSIGVEPKDAWHVFQLMKTKNKDVVVEDYVKGLLYYQGPARSVDLAMLMAETRKVWERMQLVSERENHLLRNALQVTQSSFSLEAK